MARIDARTGRVGGSARGVTFLRGTAGWPWLLLGIAITDLLMLRGRLVSHSPVVLASLFGIAVVALALRAGVLTIALVRGGRSRATAAAELLATAGALTVVCAGTANWALGLQGTVILAEGESVRLRDGAQLQAFESGPLARIDEMDVVITLEELALVDRGGGRFDPSSRIRVWQSHREFDPLDIVPGAPGTSGTLRFHQGAFGFAPRISIVHEDDQGRREVFDRVVPFTTERTGADGVAFHGRFSIAADDLDVHGRVDLDSLDEGLRGHATLWLDVSRNGHALGGGPLLPGHFAEIEDGYRVGFTDLRRWSEVVVSRRNYASWMVPGAAAVVLGWLLWIPARWRSR